MSEIRITEIRCREVVDSKARPMVETDVYTSSGHKGRSSSPYGTSVGSSEAHVLRDGGKRLRGIGVGDAVQNVNSVIAPALVGQAVTEQEAIDGRMIELDGTSRKSRLGANAIYSVSVAVARAAAQAVRLPLYRYLGAQDRCTLPLPMFNLINGGLYGDSRIEIQEFMLLPSDADNYRMALDMGIEVFYEMEDTIKKNFGAKALRMGHSAGYAAPTSDPEIVIELILDAVRTAGFEGRFEVALDCAAGEFYDREKDTYDFLGRDVPRDEMIQYLLELSEKFPIFLIEDPLHDGDFDGFAMITRLLRPLPLIAGDDLFATNVQQLEIGYQAESAQAMIFKPNMVGTVTEAMQAARWADEHSVLLIPSIRSGGGVDDPIPDFSVAIGAPLMKPGAPRSGERIVCHNRLLEIEEELGETARFPSLAKIKQQYALASPKPKEAKAHHD